MYAQNLETHKKSICGFVRGRNWFEKKKMLLRKTMAKQRFILFPKKIEEKLQRCGKY